ncbi:MAG: hypothetical protein ABL926_12315 [Novosphingobium sp.]|uniref:hypothetical protein n=1 Tax=Novosphingobium sp. TaxID=1874826 RepID=UPI0032B83F77
MGHEVFVRFQLKILSVFGLITATPCIAGPAAEYAAAVAEAEARGAQLFAYDQAAWHATDSFQADIARKGFRLDNLPAQWGAEGYIVEPASDDALSATFFGRKDGRHYAIARYTVSGSTVKGGGFLEGNGATALSPVAESMIAARRAAIEAFSKSDFGLCSRGPANTVVLPPNAQGQSAVYIFTSTTVAGIYPAGGHFRFDFDADGKLVSQRRFMKSCFDIDTRGRDGKTPAAIVMTHLLDPQPTEIHTFVSYNVPVELYVATTSSKTLWAVRKGKVRLLDKRN